jgi:putative acetyltransferase
MTATVQLRALEPADLTALQALCERPEIASILERVPTEKSLQSAPGVNVAIGAFDGARLVGAAGMSARDRPRLRHTGQAWLAADAAATAVPLLEALRGLARDWWRLDRLELVLPASTDLGGTLRETGFEVEVRRRLDLAGPGGHEDSVGFAWIRGGLTVAPSGRAFPRGSAGPAGPLVIRPTTADDATAVSRIFGEESTVWGTLQCPFTPAEVWRARIEGNESSGTRAFAAVLGGEVVGLANLHPGTGSRRPHVRALGMAVADGWQGRGVGRALMVHLVQLADALEVERLELHVYADNARAISLYERFGFVREGVNRLEAWRENAYVDTLVMGRLRRPTASAAGSTGAGGPP